jgi:hypothetical protein
MLRYVCEVRRVQLRPQGHARHCRSACILHSLSARPTYHVANDVAVDSVVDCEGMQRVQCRTVTRRYAALMAAFTRAASQHSHWRPERSFRGRLWTRGPGTSASRHGGRALDAVQPRPTNAPKHSLVGHVLVQPAGVGTVHVHICVQLCSGRRGFLSEMGPHDGPHQQQQLLVCSRLAVELSRPPTSMFGWPRILVPNIPSCDSTPSKMNLRRKERTGHEASSGRSTDAYARASMFSAGGGSPLPSDPLSALTGRHRHSRKCHRARPVPSCDRGGLSCPPSRASTTTPTSKGFSSSPHLRVV